MNRTILVGRLTRDPELRYTPNGVAVANFTLAVNRAFKTNGENEADFISVICWRAQAESVANFITKGSLVGIDGRIQTRNYDNNEGKKVYVTEVVADTVNFLEPKNKSQNDPQPQQMPQKQQTQQYGRQGKNSHYPQRQGKQNNQSKFEVTDDNLPF